jgi:competence ComEA-like helix-hairpin-helix protein
MPTPAERQAIAFLALVAALGGGARFMQARAFEQAVVGSAPPGSADALAAQAAAVDSLRARTREAPPRRSRRSSGTTASVDRHTDADPVIVNPDLASLEELDRLPGVGPALAARIVASRDSLGPFGSLEGLQRVRGIGPATAARLAEHVTFSPGFRPLHGTSRVAATPR